MRLSLSILGTEVLAVETGTHQDDPGDCTTQPVGFVPSSGDQRWEKGRDL